MRRAAVEVTGLGRVRSRQPNGGPVTTLQIRLGPITGARTRLVVERTPRIAQNPDGPELRGVYGVG